MSTTTTTVSLLRRIASRLVRPIRRRAARQRIASASARLVARGPAPDDASSGDPRATVAVVCSYRVTSPERLAILAATIGRLGAGLAGSGVPVHVIDASPPELAREARATWEASGLAVVVEDDPSPLAVALRSFATRLDRPYLCVQFDDMISTGMNAPYLGGACDLLAAHPEVGVVCPFWPLDVAVGDGDVTVTSYALDDGTYTFRGTPPIRPVLVEEHRGLRFGIFENFTYGLFVNDLVTRGVDYGARLGWYLDALGTTSAHAVELTAAPKLRGPWWTHIAVCLDGVTLLDLDHVHTDAAVRDEVPANRAVFEAVRQGADVVVRPRTAP